MTTIATTLLSTFQYHRSQSRHIFETKINDRFGHFSVPASPSTFLAETVKGLRHGLVDNVTDIWLINSHSKSNSSTYDLCTTCTYIRGNGGGGDGDGDGGDSDRYRGKERVKNKE